MKLSLAQMGLGLPRSLSMWGYLSSLFGQGRKARKSPLTQERERFEMDVKDQLLKLKEKGISIPIFTL